MSFLKSIANEQRSGSSLNAMYSQQATAPFFIRTPDRISRKLAYLEEHNKAVAEFDHAGKSYVHDAFGFPLKLSPDVYLAHPELSHSSGIVIDNLPDNLEGKHVLDMGCGTGVISLAAAYRGAANVLACDYDVNAIALTCENVRLVNPQLASVIDVTYSDVLHQIKTNYPLRQFDVVAANLWFPVYRPNNPESHLPFLNAYYRFFDTVRDVMRPDGIAFLTSAEFAETADILEIMSLYGITPHVTVAGKTHYNGTVPMDWFLYSFDANGNPVDPQEWAQRTSAPAMSPA